MQRLASVHLGYILALNFSDFSIFHPNLPWVPDSLNKKEKWESGTRLPFLFSGESGNQGNPNPDLTSNVRQNLVVYPVVLA